METEESQASDAAAEPVVESTPPAVPEWRAALPEDIRGAESLSKFDEAENPIAALASGYLGAERAVGADKVLLPGKDATDEQRREFYTRLGCPETPDKYEAPTEGVPETFDPAVFDLMREPAHRLGVNRQQLAGLAREFANLQHGAQQEHTQNQANQSEQWEQELKVKYGDAFEQNVTLARNVVDTFGGESLVELLETTGLGSHPLIVDTLNQIGRAMAEDEILGGGGGQTFTNTPEQASAEWDAMKIDQEYMDALRDVHNPGHSAAKAKQTRLFQDMNPEPV